MNRASQDPPMCERVAIPSRISSPIPCHPGPGQDGIHGRRPPAGRDGSDILWCISCWIWVSPRGSIMSCPLRSDCSSRNTSPDAARAPEVATFAANRPSSWTCSTAQLLAPAPRPHAERRAPRPPNQDVGKTRGLLLRDMPKHIHDGRGCRAAQERRAFRVEAPSLLRQVPHVLRHPALPHAPRPRRTPAGAPHEARVR